MKRLLLCLLLLFAQTTPANADVWIPKDCRIPNWGNGYCAWSCIETLGWHLKVKKLYNLSANRSKDPDEYIWNGYEWELIPNHYGTKITCERKLNALGVRYRSTNSVYDTSLLCEAVKKNACVAFMRAGAFGKEGHAIIITEYTAEKVEFINPNTSSYYTATHSWFAYWWLGYILMIEK